MAASGSGEVATATIDDPEAGVYFVIVDGVDGSGRYDLVEVTK